MLSTSWSLCTRRLSRREVALPPSTCENRSIKVASGLPYSGTFHIRRTITCGTLSSSTVRPDSASGAICTFGCSMVGLAGRSEEHTSELQSLMRISYAVFCLKKKNMKPHALRQNHTQYKQHN